MKNFLKILIPSLLISNVVFAETKEEKRVKYILSNMQKDYIICYSFYKIGTEYIRKSNGDTNIIEWVEKSSDTSLKLAHETGEMMSMTNEKMSSKIKSEMKNQLNLIDNNFSNTSILLEKYVQECKNLIEDKEQRIFFWEKKANNKFQ